MQPSIAASRAQGTSGGGGMQSWTESEVNDRRVRRTRHALARALIELTLERGYGAVTIRDITDRADVGYATFFRHYHDKEELLQDVSEVVLAELMELLRLPATEGDAIAMGTLLFRYVGEHAEMCRVLLSSRGSPTLLRRILESGAQSVLAEHAPRAGSLVPVEVAAYHLVTSSIALIRWWLEHDMPYPAERMGVIYSELIVLPTSATAFEA